MSCLFTLVPSSQRTGPGWTWTFPLRTGESGSRRQLAGTPTLRISAPTARRGSWRRLDCWCLEVVGTWRFHLAGTCSTWLKQPLLSPFAHATSVPIKMTSVSPSWENMIILLLMVRYLGRCLDSGTLFRDLDDVSVTGKGKVPCSRCLVRLHTSDRLLRAIVRRTPT